MENKKMKLDLNELDAVVGGAAGGQYSQSLSNIEDNAVAPKPAARTSVNNYGINDDGIK